MSTSLYRADIDGLRALAVLPVVLFHAGLGLPGGYVGVDVFFVISGYLIAGILQREILENRFSLLRFYERRARRIFPALFVMLAASSLAATVILLPEHLVDFGNSLRATALFVSNIYFWSMEGYFTEAAEIKPLLHTWSLAVEEQYYLIFPPLLYALMRGGGRRAAMIGLGLLAIASLGLALWQVGRAPQTAFYLPFARIWELLAGALLALAPKGTIGTPGPLWRAVIGLAGFAAIVIPVFVYDATTPFPGAAALPPVLGAVAILASGGWGAGPVRWLLERPPIRGIGLISYSLYLWHWPVIALTGYLRLEPVSGLTGLICVGAALILALLSWRVVEAPFRHPGHLPLLGRVAGPAPVLIAAVIAIAASGALGTKMVSSWGWPARFDDRLALLPPPESLLHDRRDCNFISVERLTSGDICLRGAAGQRPSFALVGDSHADALSPGMFAAAASAGQAGYQLTGPSFRPLPGVYARQGDDFRPLTEAVIAFLENHPEVQRVIVSGYWLHQATGRSYRYAGTVFMDAGYDGSGVDYAPHALVNGLGALAARLPDRQIVLLDDIPSDDRLDLRSWRRMALWRPDLLTKGAGLPRAEADAQRATWEPILRGIAARLPNVEYAPVFTEFCAPDLCSLFGPEGPRYRNGDHLSAATGLALAPRLERVLFDPPALSGLSDPEKCPACADIGSPSAKPFGVSYSPGAR